MSHDVQIDRATIHKDRTAQVVRFSTQTRAPRSSLARFLSPTKLLPHHWRRQVVIHGRRFWLPG